MLSPFSSVLTIASVTVLSGPTVSVPFDGTYANSKAVTGPVSPTPWTVWRVARLIVVFG